ncbi:UNVERIFIED_CONTAM: hypothetical protein Sradi_5098400 [Sesamum radiatum]|uniref:Reverse transcriptase RNase H-like domain-containing protein n=1 Tax=Sesamum radiatum TaxID=300843 RepID=A0AAW2M2E1_SESRA
MAQANEEGKEKALYYLNRTLTENKLKYSPVEKVCLALFYAIKKLTHYFEAYSIKLISLADPVKFVMSKHILSERFAKWSIVFNQYEIDYVFQKVVKGQALANFLADHPMPTEWEMSDDFPNDDIFSIEILLAWTMFFDGAERNRMVNALANLATTLAPSKGEMTNIPVCNRWVIPSVDPFDHEDFNAITIVTDNEKDWRTPPVEYLKHIKLPDDTRYKIEGLDVVGPITPKSSIGHIYILAATDYFLKRAEAVPLKEVKKETVKVVSKLKRDWHEKIGEALWMYQTTHRTATQSTPYSLVHGVEAALLESQIPSLCIAI